MAQAQTIKDFLVSLGFKIDTTSEKRFSQSIGKATLEVGKFALGIAAAAQGVILAADKIAKGLEQIYFATQRTGDHVADLQAFGQAMENVGVSSSEAVKSAVELGDKLREFPNMAGLYARLGISARNANGQFKGSVELIQELSVKFRDMFARGGVGRSQALAIGETLGLSKETIEAMALRSDELNASLKEYGDLNKNLGVSDETAKRAHEFENTMRKIMVVIKALSQSAFEEFQRRYGERIKEWIGYVIAHKDEILDWIESFIKGIMELAQILAEVTENLIDFLKPLYNLFKGLDPEVRKVIEVIGLLGLAAIKVSTLMSGVFMRLFGSAILLTAAYEFGHAIGEKIWDGIKDTKLADNIGRYIAVTLAALGNEDAQAAIDAEIKAEGVKEANAARGTTPKVVQNNQPIPTTPETDEVQKKLEEIDTKYSTPAAATNEARGVRNNNPGNLNYAGQPGATKEGGAGGRFAVFGTAQQGLNAMANQLSLYNKRHIDTIQDIIETYTPKSDDNPHNREEMMRIAKEMGVGINDKLDLNNPDVMARLMKNIIYNEGNANSRYTPEMIQQAAEKATVHQTNNIHVNGVSDPQRAAKQVEVSVNNANENLVRNMRGPVLA